MANKKNKGVIPPMEDERVKYVPIGCQQCIECRKQKARSWQVRLLEDLKQHKNGKFITLTFNNESIKHLYEKIKAEEKENNQQNELTGYEIDNEIATKATRLFLERWRKKYKRSLRHWLVTEIGHAGTENIHLHGIVWTNAELKDLEKIWSYGYVWKGKEINGKIINYVNERTVNYIVKYIHKVDADHKLFKSKILTSPGIGANYTARKNGDWNKNKFNGKETKETYRTRQGYKIAMPIYWRNKIYSEKEREKLWLQRLDKEERWVCGERVSIKNGEETYYKLLQWHRQRNAQLGYGNGDIPWERKQYEKERRAIMRKKRMEATERKSEKKDTSFFEINTIIE